MTTTTTVTTTTTMTTTTTVTTTTTMTTTTTKYHFTSSITLVHTKRFTVGGGILANFSDPEQTDTRAALISAANDGGNVPDEYIDVVFSEGSINADVTYSGVSVSQAEALFYETTTAIKTAYQQKLQQAGACTNCAVTTGGMETVDTTADSCWHAGISATSAVGALLTLIW